MMRLVTRLWLALWAGLLAAPRQYVAAAEVSGAPVLTTRDASAVVSRLPGTPRLSQGQDHASGSDLPALPSAGGSGPRSFGAFPAAAVPAEPRAIRSAVLPGNYPTGPPELS